MTLTHTPHRPPAATSRTTSRPSARSSPRPTSPSPGRCPTTSTAATCASAPTRSHDPGEHHHWFLGEGMVHGVRLRDGQAQWYRNRWVRSADVATTLGRAGPRHARRVGLRGQHQRARARRAHAGPGRGRLPAVRAHPRPRHRRALRLRRHPAQPAGPAGLHRPPARGPGDRRAARGLLQLDARQPRRLLGARPDGPDPAQRRHHRRTAAR